MEEFLKMVNEALKEQGDATGTATADTKYKDVGMDSLTTLTLMSDADEKLGIRIDPKGFSDNKTFGEIYESAQRQ